MLHAIGHGDLRGLFGGIRGKEQAWTTIWMRMRKGNVKKQTTESNETKTSTHKFMRTKQKDQKNNRKKLAKKSMPKDETTQ